MFSDGAIWEAKPTVNLLGGEKREGEKEQKLVHSSKKRYCGGGFFWLFLKKIIYEASLEVRLSWVEVMES